MCHSGNTLNTSDDLRVYLATNGCFKTMDTLSAWTEHKVFKYPQYMERNKKSLNRMYHVLIVVWLVIKLNDFIQIYLWNWMTFYLTFILHQD